jgi:hypothetical protein
LIGATPETGRMGNFYPEGLGFIFSHLSRLRLFKIAHLVREAFSRVFERLSEVLPHLSLGTTGTESNTVNSDQLYVALRFDDHHSQDSSDNDDLAEKCLVRWRYQ